MLAQHLTNSGHVGTYGLLLVSDAENQAWKREGCWGILSFYGHGSSKSGSLEGLEGIIEGLTEGCHSKATLV